MKFLSKMERKYGRFAIRGLTRFIIGAYVIGYFLLIINPYILNYLSLEPYFVLKGQIWRLITWVMIPPSGFDLFTIIMLMFYFSIGSSLERAWGSFRYNVYILGGLLFTVLGAFICYAIQAFVPSMPITSMGGAFSTYYICMSLFLAFSATYPDMMVYLFFIIPLKVKWLSAIYVASIIMAFVESGWIGRIAIVVSILNFLIFFLMTRNMKRFTPHEIKRKQEFKKSVTQAQPKMMYRYKCAVCGKNEQDNPDLEFRYCSKCNGSYVYCQDHLFTHEHIK